MLHLETEQKAAWFDSSSPGVSERFLKDKLEETQVELDRTLMPPPKSREPSKPQKIRKTLGGRNHIQTVNRYQFCGKGSPHQKQVLHDVEVTGVLFNRSSQRWTLMLASDIPIRSPSQQPRYTDCDSGDFLYFNISALIGESTTLMVPIDRDLYRYNPHIISFKWGWDIRITREDDCITAVELLRR